MIDIVLATNLCKVSGLEKNPKYFWGRNVVNNLS